MTLRHHLPALLLLLPACSSLSDEATMRLEVFDTYVDTLAENYPFFAQKHIDWQGLSRSYRAAVVSAGRPSEFYHLLAGLLSELDDPHVSLDVPDACWHRGGAESSSLYELRGFGTFSVEREVYVSRWPVGLAPVPPAHLPEELRTMPRISRIQGARVTLPLLDTLTRGEPGATVEMQLTWADGTRTRHVLTLPEPTPPAIDLVPGQVLTIGGTSYRIEPEPERSGLDEIASLSTHGDYALLTISSLAPGEVGSDVDGFREHIDELLDEVHRREPPGLIIDLRDNSGGKLEALIAVASRCVDHDVLIVGPVERSSLLFGLITVTLFSDFTIEPRGERLTTPIAVLTSARTGSAAEWLSRLLQRECGAVVVGEQTIGAEASIMSVRGGDGTTLTFGKNRFLERNGAGFQDEGVTPDISVRLTLDDVRRAGSFPAARYRWNTQLLAATERALRERAERAAR